MHEYVIFASMQAKNTYSSPTAIDNNANEVIAVRQSTNAMLLLNYCLQGAIGCRDCIEDRCVHVFRKK